MRRLGHPRDVTAIFSDDPEEKSAYIWGIIIVPIILGIFFTLWTMACFGLLCLGQKRVGFLSGASLKVPAETTHAGRQGTSLKSNPKRPKRVRIAFLASAVILLLAIIPLVLLGFHNFYETTVVAFDASEVRLLGSV